MRVEYKRIGVFIFCLLFTFMFLYFVFAVNVSPLTYSVNESVSSLYNITVTDVNITQVNITLPANFTFVSGTNGSNVSSQVIVNFTNTTGGILIWKNSTASFYLLNGLNSTKFWFNATSSYPGTYNFSVSVMNSTNTYVNHSISITVNDTTNPTASFGTNPVDVKNSSSANVTFDVKCSDGYSVNDAVVFGNFSGTWAINQTNTSMVNNTYWNFSLSLSDGFYIWGVYCNDSANNSDWTNSNRTLVVDTISPSATASCTSATIHAGDALTCSCSGTDATSGVSSVTPTSVVDTSDLSGSYTYTCSVVDYAGNSASGSYIYTVSGGSSALGGSSSSTSLWTGTFIVSDDNFAKGYTKEFSEKQRVKVEINSENHYIGVIDLTASTATINITSEPQQIILSVGDERKIEVTGDNYYDILIKLLSINNGKANLTVQSINEIIVEESTPAEEKEQESTGSVEDVSERSNLWWIIILVVVAIILIVLFLLKMKKSSKVKKFKKYHF